MKLRELFRARMSEPDPLPPEPVAPAVDQELMAAQKIYAQQLAAFESYLDRSGAPDSLRRYYWYHTVDLGDGVVTPGDYDYRAALPNFGFPEDMRGMTVLDIGAATGFFSFEFERRGANVVCVELPSLDRWDIVRHRRADAHATLTTHHAASSVEEAYHLHLRAPFDFCKERLGSKVRRVFSPVYDLTPEMLGRTSFDIVFLGDILLHLFSPFAALEVAAAFTGGTLVVATDLVPLNSDLPLLQFLGRVSAQHDRRTWWAFNHRAIVDMLTCVGLDQVRVAGNYKGVLRRDWGRYNRAVFHASRR